MDNVLKDHRCPILFAFFAKRVGVFPDPRTIRTEADESAASTPWNSHLCKKRKGGAPIFSN